jgi:hypothetical protein
MSDQPIYEYTDEVSQILHGAIYLFVEPVSFNLEAALVIDVIEACSESGKSVVATGQQGR